MYVFEQFFCYLQFMEQSISNSRMNKIGKILRIVKIIINNQISLKIRFIKKMMKEIIKQIFKIIKNIYLKKNLIRKDNNIQII